MQASKIENVPQESGREKEQYMNEWYKRKLKKLEHSFMTKIKNFRADILTEAREFVKA